MPEAVLIRNRFLRRYELRRNGRVFAHDTDGFRLRAWGETHGFSVVHGFGSGRFA